MALPASDLFPGSGALSASWSQQRTDFTISLDGAGNATAASTNFADSTIDAARWTADTLTSDQWSEIIVGALGNSASNRFGASVRCSADVGKTALDCYTFLADNTGAIALSKWVNGVETVLASGSMAVAAGVAMRLSVIGTALVAKRNGVSVLTATDAALTTGAPGIALYHASKGSPTIASWSADNEAAAASYTLVLAAGSYAVTGAATGLRATRALALVPGAYAVTGRPAGLAFVRRLILAAGSYVATGAAAGLSLSRRLTLAAGSYAATGTATGLRSARRLALAVGGYALSGRAVGLLGSASTYVFVLASGAYTITGRVAGLVAARALSLAPGQYVATGRTIALSLARRLALGAGSYATTGRATTLSIARRLALVPGAYVAAGRAVGVRLARRFALDAGRVTVNGFPIGLSRLGTNAGHALVGALAPRARFTGTVASSARLASRSTTTTRPRFTGGPVARVPLVGMPAAHARLTGTIITYPAT